MPTHGQELPSVSRGSAGDRPFLVFACDEPFAMPLATTFRSIVETSRALPHHFHVLTSGFSAPARARVLDSLPPGSASIFWIEISVDAFDGFATRADVTPMTFARLLIPRLVPDDVRRVLYLDSDLLIREDLTPLWETSLNGAVAGAVLDHLDPQVKNGRRVEGMPRVDHYFNAGVLLIDVAAWRSARISENALEYLRRNPRTPFMDQDALNVALDGRWERLPARWNFQNHYGVDVSRMTGGDRPAIVHFVTGLKPWLASSISPNARLYDCVRARTLYARSPRNIVADAVQASWYRLKRLLRRSRTIQRMEFALRAPRTAHGQPTSQEHVLR